MQREVRRPILRVRFDALESWRRNHAWHLLVAIGLLSTALGMVGFRQYDAARGALPRALADYLYLALQLFPMNSGAVEPLAGGAALPWALQIARFLSPAVTAFALLSAAAAVFHRQVDAFRASRAAGHVILCGLGPRSIRLARGWRSQGSAVVVIEPDPVHPLLSAARELGVMVIQGDPTDGGALCRAGIVAASSLIAPGDDDTANVQIALQAAQLAAGRRGDELSCVVHLRDQRLWRLMRDHEFPAQANPHFRIQFFNVYAAAATALLRAYPLFAQAPAEDPAEPSAALLTAGQPTVHGGSLYMVAGLDPLAEQLLLQASQRWCLGRADAEARLPVVVAGPDAAGWVADLVHRCPLIGRVCELAPFTDPGAAPLARIDRAYICLDDPQDALCLALDLQPRLPPDCRIVVQLPEENGLAALFTLRDGKAGAAPAPFYLLDHTFGPNLLDDGTHENLARAIQTGYVRSAAALGHTAADTPNMVPWEALPEGVKQSNRRQAGEFGVKLRLAGCGYEPWTVFGAERFAFSPAEIETLAQAEHDRWCADKQRQGWRYGPQRDDAARIHPDLVPWATLSAEAKDKDRAPVRQIPTLLAQAGFQIFRFPSSCS